MSTFLDALAAFWETPGGKLFASLVGAILSYLGLWLKSWRAERKAKREKAEAREGEEQEEERDWEARSKRTEADLENLDAYTERLALHLRSTSQLWEKTVEWMWSRSQGQEDARMIARIEQSLLVVKVELEAHKQQRPAYLKRLHEAQEAQGEGAPPKSEGDKGGA